jgi:UDP-glucose 4-epimerase
VAKGELSQLKVFGADYQTRDGTGIRDYIHVEDLAAAHVSAMDWTLENRGFEAVNVGTGKGYSVLDVIDRFRRVNDIPVDFAIEERRPGDVAECYAACDKAADLLGFRAQLDLDAMLSSAWAWEQNKS